MTRRPFTSAEIGLDDSALDEIAGELEQLGGADAIPSPGFHDRVLAAIANEAPDRGTWLAGLLAPRRTRAWQGAVMAAVAVAGITVALLAGGLLDQMRQLPGSSPSLVPSPTAPPATPSPTPTPAAMTTPAATASPRPSDVVPTADPTHDGDDASETPEPSGSDSSGPGGSDDDDVESLRPSESDSPSSGG